MPVHIEEASPDRVVARVPSSWRGRDYYVDLLGGRWYCTCWKAADDRPCSHIRAAQAHLRLSERGEMG